jgi:hypothetical protein
VDVVKGVVMPDLAAQGLYLFVNLFCHKLKRSGIYFLKSVELTPNKGYNIAKPENQETRPC